METARGLQGKSIIDTIPLGSYQIAVITLCSLVAMVDGFDTQVIALAAPEIARALDIPIAKFGVVFGAGLLGSMIGALIAGSMSDRMGRKPSLLVSMLIFGGASLVLPLATSVNELILLRLIAGLGLGGAMPGIVALTSEYTPQRIRATLTSAMFCGYPLGASIGAAASAWILTHYGWQTIFVIGGLVPLVLLPIVGFWVPESLRFLHGRGKDKAIARIMRRLGIAGAKPVFDRDEPDQRSHRFLLGELFARGRAIGTLLLWATFFVSLLLSYFLINWIPSITRQAGLLTEGAVGAVALLNIGGIIGSFALSWFVERIGPYRVIAFGYTVGAIAIATIGFAGSSLFAAFVSVFIAGFFTIGAQLCVVALAAVYYPLEIRATGVGWTMTIGRLGAVVGPVAGGILIGAGVNAQGLFALAAVASFLAGSSVWLMGRLHRPDNRFSVIDIDSLDEAFR